MIFLVISKASWDTLFKTFVKAISVFLILCFWLLTFHTKSSTYFSRCNLLIINPPSIHITIPAITYNIVTFNQNIPTNKARATSLISGDVIRKAKVTHNGILASIKPINKGIDEQEQKGVIAQKTVAKK